MHSMRKTMLNGHYIRTDQSCRPEEWTRVVDKSDLAHAAVLIFAWSFSNQLPLRPYKVSRVQSSSKSLDAEWHARSFSADIANMPVSFDCCFAEDEAAFQVLVPHVPSSSRAGKRFHYYYYYHYYYYCYYFQVWSTCTHAEWSTLT